MKLTAFFTIVGLVASVAASPVPEPEVPANLESRSCPAGIVLEGCLRLCKTDKCRRCCNQTCVIC
ncbi:hypothetical protein VTG60DRAFT_2670 [Thermothelomyces hinnuleus]